jgi:hypothetical protein
MPTRFDQEASCRDAGFVSSRERTTTGRHLGIWIKRVASLKVSDARAKGRRKVSIFLNPRFARAASRV